MVNMRVIVYRANEHLHIGNIHCIPIDYFLLRLNPSDSLSKTIGSA
ncbi:MAG: hypothetical protein JW863_09360 [Chitinispirillaceae bacterium]|nr:hypothetical protein [Chitinispirillaceae bacterium]